MSAPESAGWEDGRELDSAPKPAGLWDEVGAQVDEVFADFSGGDYGWLSSGQDSGFPDSGRGPE